MLPNFINQKGIAFIPALIWTLVAVTGVIASYRGGANIGDLIISQRYQNQSAASSISPSVTPYIDPNPTIPPLYSKPKPTTDLDPVVACPISKECGGGSKQLKSSVCSNSTCCGINGKWVFYHSKNKCTQDQNVQSQITKTGVDCLVGDKLYNYPSQEKCKADQHSWKIIKQNAQRLTQEINRMGEEAILSQQQILQDNLDKLKEITGKTYSPQYTSPTFTVPTPPTIKVQPEPCVVVPPGFGGATSGRVNEAGLPCAN